MKTRLIITENEKNHILSMYGKVLNEGGIGGIFSTVEKYGAKTAKDIAADLVAGGEKLTIKLAMDDIIKRAFKNPTEGKKEIDNLIMSLMQNFNPGNDPKLITQAQTQVSNFLNGYAISRNYKRFRDIIQEVEESTSKVGSAKTKTPQFKSTLTKSTDPLVDFFEKNKNYFKGLYNNGKKKLTEPDKKGLVQSGFMKLDSTTGKYKISKRKLLGWAGVLGIGLPVLIEWLGDEFGIYKIFVEFFKILKALS